MQDAEKGKPEFLLEGAALSVLRAGAAEAWAEIARRSGPEALLGEALSISAPESVRSAARRAESLRVEIAKLHEKGVLTLAAGSAAYPPDLLQIHSPPPLIFVRGKIPPAWPLCVAVVGSRSASSSGCAFARDLSKQLARAGACIVSGFAAGIDGAAHRGAMDVSGAQLPTIAVLGCGVDIVYPALHARLAAEMLERGGIFVSHFEPGTRPYPSHFLDRNRIIAGFSRAVVVVEAARRSGALSTARRALESGREVLAVPGPPLSALHAGCHALIREGARLCTGIEDVAESVPELTLIAADDSRASSRSAEILACVPRGEVVPIECVKAKIASKDVHARILELELEGEIEILPGGLVQRR